MARIQNGAPGPSTAASRRWRWEIGDDLSRRLTHIFLKGPNGRRPVFGANEMLQTQPNWCDHVPFYEYFHGDTGEGLGATHQTGWTALVARLLEQTGGR